MAKRVNNKSVFISKETTVNGNIAADKITVAGDVKGNLKAETKILITKDGSVDGDLQAVKIFLQEGGHHEGIITLLNPE